MTFKRMCQTIRLCCTMGSGKRTKYLKKHQVFHHMGDNCSIMMRIVPLYPELIGLGNNVNLASNVHFHTHDGINNLLNKMESAKKQHFQEGLGCINIGNNVCIGAHTIINYGVNIGDNVIISAGSVVSSDVPSDCVVRGNPATVVCSIKDFRRMRLMKTYYPKELAPRMGGNLEKPLIDYMWNDFYKTRKNNKAEE